MLPTRLAPSWLPGALALCAAVPSTASASPQSPPAQVPDAAVEAAADDVAAGTSEAAESPWLVTPTFSVDPKLGSTLGGVAGYIRRLDPDSNPSLLTFFGGYSNNNGCGGPSNPYASFYMEMSAETGACGAPTIGTIYCTSNPNSTGSNTSMTLLGSASAAANDLTLSAGNLPPNTFGFFLYSPTQGSVPNPGGSQGDLCLGGAIGRFVGAGQVKSSGAGSEITLSTTSGEWDLGALPGPTGSSAAVAGNTANFQAWHRDANPTVTSNFSDGITVTWQ